MFTDGECIICGREKENHENAIYEPCELCREEFLSKGVLIIVVKNNNNESVATGKVVVIKDSSYEELFEGEKPENKIMFLSPGEIIGIDSGLIIDQII